MALAFPWTSAAVLLHPLPEAALPSFLHVLRDVPHSLAEPFIRHELSRHGISAEPHDVRNVLFKLRAAGLAHDVVGSIGPSLKALQKDVLDKPMMYIREDRESCVTCSEALCDGQRYESFDQQMSAGMRRNAPAEGPTRFRAFTFHAGFQFAVFQPKLCRACRWHYIAGWTYRADRNHITACKWIGPCPRTWFVIPKLRSWLAIDMALLSVLDSQLLHQKASFQSMFRVWADMHPEPWQQRLLRGDLGTQERHNTQRLEDGWMTWSATKWAGGRDPHIRWDFSSAETFDLTLCSYKPVLDDTLFSSVVDHIPACPRCTHLLALITDGKAGAGRCVCSNLNKFRLIPELQAMIHTGCEEHADSYHLYCSSCDVDLSATALGGVATSRQARVLEARVAPDLQPPELLYMVEFADGVARKLRRREVRPDILRTFETTRARRRCVRKRQRQFSTRPPDAKRRKLAKAAASVDGLPAIVELPKVRPEVETAPKAAPAPGGPAAVDLPRLAPQAEAAPKAAPALGPRGASRRTAAASALALAPATQAPKPPAPLPGTRRPGKAFFITKKQHIQKYGPSLGCMGCLFTAPHSAACRERIEERILEDPDMSAQVHKYMERWQKAQNAEPAVVRVVKQVEPLKSAASAAPAAATPKVRRPSRKFATGRRKARLRAQRLVANLVLQRLPTTGWL